MNIQVPMYEQRSSFREKEPADDCGNNMNVDGIQHRATREFVPADKKDEKYWFKRVRNNASARKSRMKRKAMDCVMERKLLALHLENFRLRNELAALNIICMRRSLDAPSVREDGSSNSSGKSEIDDFRSESPSVESKCSSSSYSSESCTGKLPLNRKYNYGSNEENIYSGVYQQIHSIPGFFRPTQGHHLLPLNTQIVMNGRSELNPFMMKRLGDSCKVKKEGTMPENNQKIQQIPHKIRIKERMHSAFQRD